MSEYIVRMPPDMPYEIRAELNAWYVESEPIVRCRDCDSASFDEFGGGWCNENCREIKAWNFCAWGARRQA